MSCVFNFPCSLFLFSFRFARRLRSQVKMACETLEKNNSVSTVKQLEQIELEQIQSQLTEGVDKVCRPTYRLTYAYQIRMIHMRVLIL
jgi:hypothetical protein